MEVFEEINGLVLNPNKSTVGAIVSRCVHNDGHCPCTPEKDDDHLCPCKKVRNGGDCCCTLYVKKSSEG